MLVNILFVILDKMNDCRDVPHANIYTDEYACRHINTHACMHK